MQWAPDFQIASVCVLFAASLAAAAPPAATVFYSVDGSSVSTVVLLGTPGADGTQHYEKAFNGPNGAWRAHCSFTVDFKADPKSFLSGTITMRNDGTDVIEFAFGVDVPLCPAIDGGSVLGGAAVVSLNAVDGGAVASSGTEPILRAIADGVTAAKVFMFPTFLGTTGSGTMALTESYGLPVPSALGPDSIDIIGARQKLTLTAGDSAAVEFTLVFSDATPTIASGCPADVSGDGAVGPEDLAALLGSWGQTSDCSVQLDGDLTQDGVVDAADLAALLGMWGPCEPG